MSDVKDMPEDLRWLAENVSEWRHKDCDLVRVDYGERKVAVYTGSDCHVFPRDRYYTKGQLIYARQQLGLDSGISEPDEEECIKLAEARMSDKTDTSDGSTASYYELP